jgi:hypothetical protein
MQFKYEVIAFTNQRDRTALINQKHYSAVNQSLGEIKPLKQHQLNATEKYGPESSYDYAPLFFEAGCGKSGTALRLAKMYWDQKLIDTILIIAPNKIHRTWYMEHVPEWLKDVMYNAQIFGGFGGKNVIQPVRHPENVLQILCVNIDTFSTPEKWKKVVDWTLDRKCFTILDEATIIKNIKAKRTERLLTIFNDVQRHGKKIVKSTPRCVFRTALTGTPVTNSVVDLWPIMEWMKQGYWGRNYYSFQNRYCMMFLLETDHAHIKIPLTYEAWNAIKRMDDYNEAFHVFGINEDTWYVIKKQSSYQGPNKHLEELKEKLHTDASFVKLVECEDMPPQDWVKRIIPMGIDQQAHYDQLEKEMITEFEGRECSVPNKLVLYIRLQQIANGFISVKPLPDFKNQEEAEEHDITPNEIIWFKDVPKLDVLYQDIESAEKPCLIFTRFSCEAARIYDDLCKRGLRTSLQTGWKTVGKIEDYQQGLYDVMVANIQSMSRGFNLQNGYNTHYYSNLFSLELRIQGEGRTFRIGQTKPTRYFDYISEDTIDMKVVAALRQRREVMDYVTRKSVTEFLCEWDMVFEEEYSSIYGSRI